MQELAHFCLGATCALILLEWSGLREKLDLGCDLPLVFISGLWAMLPDLPNIGIPFLPHTNPFTNVFWFHQLLDILDPQDLPLFSAIFYGIFGLVAFLATVEEKKKRSMKKGVVKMPEVSKTEPKDQKKAVEGTRTAQISAKK